MHLNWSNDGTGSGGGQPTNSVTLSVNRGLYSVSLGDAALANMTTVPSSVFLNGDVRLRVWFNDGSNGWQLLSPDQRIAAVGYAMTAASVNLPTTSATAGSITQNGVPLLHTYGNENFFAGANAGNFTMTGTGRSTAIGAGALATNTTGFENTAGGWQALFHNMTGHNNTAMGSYALHDSTGSDNIAIGNRAGQNLTNGSNNIYIGHQGVDGETSKVRLGASQTDTYLSGVIHGDGSGLTGIAGTNLSSNLTLGGTTTFTGGISLPATTNATTGVISQNGNRLIHTYGGFNFFAGPNAGNFIMTGLGNAATGYQALSSNTAGGDNTAIGTFALQANTSGASNTASGSQAMQANTTGHSNTASGYRALSSNTTGITNTAIGSLALLANKTSNGNTAIGMNALRSQSFENGGNPWSTNNVAVGYRALYANQPTSSINGLNNTAIGSEALQGNTTGYANTAIGNGALASNTTGQGNIALGSLAGQSLTGSNNIAIGNSGVAGESNTIRIGSSTHTHTYIAGHFHVDNEVTCTAINITSDRDAKEGFTPVDTREVLDKVARLPISEWQYKTQSDARHIGPMAQDFHAAFAVGRDERHITNLDADGVALAAIQGLNQKLEAQVRDKEARISELEKSIEELKNLVKDLARKRNGGGK